MIDGPPSSTLDYAHNSGQQHWNGHGGIVMLGSFDKWWSALLQLVRLYALATYCYLSYWAAYTTYTSNSSAAGTQSGDGITEYTITGRSASIPIRPDKAQAAQFEGYTLYATRDGGKTWQPLASAKSTDEDFNFTVPEDGAYGFAVQVKMKDGTLDPPSTDTLRVVYRIRFGAHSTARQPANETGRDGELESFRGRVDELEKRLERAERQKSPRESESKELRERIERLEKRLAELEKDEPAKRDP
jgi:hypothetical protein